MPSTSGSITTGSLAFGVLPACALACVNTAFAAFNTACSNGTTGGGPAGAAGAGAAGAWGFGAVPSSAQPASAAMAMPSSSASGAVGRERGLVAATVGAKKLLVSIGQCLPQLNPLGYILAPGGRQTCGRLLRSGLLDTRRLRRRQ